MKSNIVIFTIVTVYFLVLATVYTVWNLISHDTVEWAGTMSIYGSAGLSAFIAGYLWLVQKKQGGVLVEDLPDSDIDDADPELGEFSPWSWWPIMLALSISLVMLGMSVGGSFWLSFLTAPLVIITIIGWVFEYYRGHFAR